MRLKSLFSLILLLFLASSCELFNSSSNDNDPQILELDSQIAADVLAKDVVQVNDRIFVFGEAENKTNWKNDFYLAEISKEGRLLWEKMYGGANTEIPYVMISTSDSNLLLVGGTKNNELPGNDMFVVKVDLNGALVWSNTYGFDPDQVDFGDNYGRAVAEVKSGYIIGGQGSLSERNQGMGAGALTKIGFDGQKIWSKAISNNSYGSIRGLQSNKAGTQITATGILNNADFIVYDAQNADTVKIINQIRYDDYLMNLARIGDSYITPGNSNYQLDLLSISESRENINKKSYTDFERQLALNIDVLQNATVTTGFTTDDNLRKRDIYAVKNTADLSTIWTFYYNGPQEYDREEAVGAFALPNLATGIVANRYQGKHSKIILLKIDKDAKLVSFYF